MAIIFFILIFFVLNTVGETITSFGTDDGRGGGSTEVKKGGDAAPPILGVIIAVFLLGLATLGFLGLYKAYNQWRHPGQIIQYDGRPLTFGYGQNTGAQIKPIDSVSGQVPKPSHVGSKFHTYYQDITVNKDKGVCEYHSYSDHYQTNEEIEREERDCDRRLGSD